MTLDSFFGASEIDGISESSVGDKEHGGLRLLDLRKKGLVRPGKTRLVRGVSIKGIHPDRNAALVKVIRFRTNCLKSGRWSFENP